MGRFWMALDSLATGMWIVVAITAATVHPWPAGMAQAFLVAAAFQAAVGSASRALRSVSPEPPR